MPFAQRPCDCLKEVTANRKMSNYSPHNNSPASYQRAQISAEKRLNGGKVRPSHELMSFVGDCNVFVKCRRRNATHIQCNWPTLSAVHCTCESRQADPAPQITWLSDNVYALERNHRQRSFNAPAENSSPLQAKQQVRAHKSALRLRKAVCAAAVRGAPTTTTAHWYSSLHTENITVEPIHVPPSNTHHCTLTK